MSNDTTTENAGAQGRLTAASYTADELLDFLLEQFYVDDQQGALYYSYREDTAVHEVMDEPEAAEALYERRAALAAQGR